MGGRESKSEEKKEKVFQRTWARSMSIDWTELSATAFRESINRRRLNQQDEPIKSPNILFFGPSGCGKSSLFNGFKSAMEATKDVSGHCAAGSLPDSYTKRMNSCYFKKFCTIDMPGIRETSKIPDENIEKIVSGQVPFDAQLNEDLSVRVGDSARISENNDVACVVIVLNLCMQIPHEIKRMLNCIFAMAGDDMVTYRVVLTHADICDSKFKEPENLPSIFDSPAVQKAVMAISRETGIQPNFISVVRNYIDESETNLHSNVLLLHALDKVVNAAYEQAEKKENRRIRKGVNLSTA